MPERKEILKINVITDDDTGMWSIGEIDGIFQEDVLAEFIDDYGYEHLVSHLAFLSYQVIRIHHSKVYEGDSASAESKSVDTL